MSVPASEAERGRWNKAFKTVSLLLVDLSVVGAPPSLGCWEPLRCSCALMAGGEAAGKRVLL